MYIDSKTAAQSFSAVDEVQRIWLAEPGDVFMVTIPAIGGLERLMVDLVKGGWDTGLPQSAPVGEDSWSSKRRCFSMLASPNNTPCQYPFDTRSCGTRTGPEPKVLVLPADLRRTVTSWWRFSQARAGFTGPLVDFVKALVRGQPRVFAEQFDSAVAWAQEAALRPEQVGLHNAERLGSTDPKVVLAELETIAKFLEVPPERAEHLTAQLFDLASEHSGTGHPFEAPSADIHLFEDAASMMEEEELRAWESMVSPWVQSTNACLVQLAQACDLQFCLAASLSSFKGLELHLANACRPCVFAAKGSCRFSEERCEYCHLQGHTLRQRPSKETRDRRRARGPRDERAPR